VLTAVRSHLTPGTDPFQVLPFNSAADCWYPLRDPATSGVLLYSSPWFIQFVAISLHRLRRWRGNGLSRRASLVVAGRLYVEKSKDPLASCPQYRICRRWWRKVAPTHGVLAISRNVAALCDIDRQADGKFFAKSANK
jgi:hypothetical protein